MNKHVWVFTGTYTRMAPYLQSANGEGVYSHRLDLATGQLTYVGQVGGVENPVFLAPCLANGCLYASSEMWGWNEGVVSAFAVDGDNGTLRYLNMQPSKGSLPCYVSVNHAGTIVLTANYMTGNVTVFPIDTDGGLLPASDKAQHSGSGPHAERQDGPHAHCFVTDPTDKWAVAVDLGLDKLFTYGLQPSTGKLVKTDGAWFEVEPGSGPRHLIFHPSGAYAYLVQELSSTVTALAYDSTRGTFAHLQTESALPAGFSGDNSSAAIQVSPCGKWLYASNRGDDSIVIFAIDPGSGRLTYLGHESTQGRTARSFAIDPTGTFLLVGNQDSDTVVTFRIDHETGHLVPTGHVAQIPSPACIRCWPTT